jgi:hypothetical protein
MAKLAIIQQQSLNNGSANRHESNNSIATREYNNNGKRCFLCCLCRDITYKQDKLEARVTELVSYSENCSLVVVSCCCEKVVAETGGSSETQRNGNVHRWKPLSGNG